MTAFAGTAALQSSDAFAAGGAAAMPLVAHVTQLRQGDMIKGVLPDAQPMHIVVALKMRNRAQLDSLIASHQILAPGQFAAQHAPTVTQANAVARYLKLMGYKNVVIAPNRMLVSADGNASNARGAFLTTFASVQKQDGRMAFANNSDAHIPAVLQNSVLSVIGLQNVNTMHTFARVQPSNGAHTQAVTGHLPNEFSSIYSGTGVATGAGVTVGIITQGKITQTITDLNTFTNAHGFATVTTQTVNTGGSRSC